MGARFVIRRRLGIPGLKNPTPKTEPRLMEVSTAEILNDVAQSDALRDLNRFETECPLSNS
jgi:hypothetical protein